jgi:O-antigen/teichoic acid export membrane protein
MADASPAGLSDSPSRSPTSGAIIGSALGWVSISQLGRQVLLLVVTAVLARLLVPGDFGLMSLTLVVVGLLALIRDLGTSVTIVQVPALTGRLTATLFWANVALGVGAVVGVAVLAPFIAAAFGEPRLADIVTISAFAFSVSSLSVVQQALLERAMRFRRVATIELLAVFAGGTVAIAAALGGLGVWSLVAQAIATAAVSAVLYTVEGGWRPTREFSLTDLRSVAGFGLSVTGFNVFNYAARNADYVLIGAALGAGPLGQYTLAYRVMLYPLQAVSSVISRATFPVYARLQADDTRFRELYLQAVSLIAVIAFPMVFGVMATSDRLVAVVFGPNWAEAGQVLAILAPIGLVQVIVTTVGPLYQAKGRSALMLAWGTASGTLTVVAFAIGLRWGLIGVAAAYLVVTVVTAYPGLAVPYGLIGLKVRSMLATVARPAVCGGTMFAAVAIASRLSGQPVGSAGTLAVLVLAGGAIYVILSVALNRAALRALLEAATGTRMFA